MMRHLIVYAKRPQPGYAKTRLGAAIGMEQAAGVYARLLYAYLLDLVRGGLADTHVEISVASPADVPFFAAAFPELLVRPQVEGDLGQRLAASFAQAFAAGAEVVVVTTSDTPGLDRRLVDAAFRTLGSAPVVIGPAARWRLLPDRHARARRVPVRGSGMEQRARAGADPGTGLCTGSRGSVPA
jgi:glycosyltransferase A (GT-A) superfamily protein (DUF2064 family)